MWWYLNDRACCFISDRSAAAAADAEGTAEGEPAEEEEAGKKRKIHQDDGR